MIVFIALRAGKAPVQLNIKTFDNLIIHKKILKVNEEGVIFGSKWSVTHTPSGYSAFDFQKKWQAKLFKSKMSYIDWSPIDVVKTLSSEQKDYVVRIKTIIYGFKTQKDYKNFSDWPTL